MTVTDLAASELFQNYCLNPTTETIRYWEDWQIQHPEHQAVFAEAKVLVQSLAIEPSEKEINAAFIDFKRAVDIRQDVRKAKLVAITNQGQAITNRRSLMAIAATVTVLLTVGFWQYFSLPTTTLVQDR